MAGRRLPPFLTENLAANLDAIKHHRQLSFDLLRFWP